MSWYALPEHVADKWRALASDEVPKVQMRLDEAEALLKRKVPGLDQAMLDGTVDPILVRMVLTDAVVRVLQNPHGVTSQTVGPESATYAREFAAGRVVFTDDELEQVSPRSSALTISGHPVGSARLRRPDWCLTYETRHRQYE